MSVHVEGVGFVEIDESIDACIDYLRNGRNVEKRVACAVWLGMCGDARAFVPIEEALAKDSGSVLVEGAFVDSYVDAKQYYREALAVLASRVERDPRDAERSRALAAQATGPVKQRFSSMGVHAKTLMHRAKNDPDPEVRARSLAILRGELSMLHADDEEVRLAALAGDPTQVCSEAMALFASTLSLGMRRAIADLWVRNEQRRGASVAVSEALRFLADEDAEVRRMIAKHIVETNARVHPAKDASALHELAREILGEPPESKPVVVTEHIAEYERRRTSALEEAIATAHATGKEPFDWAQFLASGCRPHGEEEHRRDYYVANAEVRTMAEYIAMRKQLEPWEDSR